MKLLNAGDAPKNHLSKHSGVKGKEHGNNNQNNRELYYSTQYKAAGTTDGKYAERI